MYNNVNNTFLSKPNRFFQTYLTTLDAMQSLVVLVFHIYIS